MASAQRRGSRWIGRYRALDGRERTKTLPTRREAVAWATAQEHAVRNQTWTDPARAKVTVGDMASVWFAGLNIKPKTSAAYKSLLDTLVLPEWGTVRIGHVTTSHVRTWVAGMTGVRGQPLSASRRTQAFRVLSSILDVAVADGRLPRNPAKPLGAGRRGTFLPKITTQKRRRYLTHSQLHELAHAAGDDRALVLLLGYTGLRFGEAAALRLNDVDLMRKRIRVDESLSEVNGLVEFVAPKTHTFRAVPVPALLEPLILAQMAGKEPQDLLFTAARGGPLRLGNWRRNVFDKAVIATELTPFTPHDLRHTAASLAVASGANVKVVQRMLGHADATLTLNTYADLFDGDLDEVAQRLNDAASSVVADFSRTAAVLAVTVAVPAESGQAV